MASLSVIPTRVELETSCRTVDLQASAGLPMPSCFVFSLCETCQVQRLHFSPTNWPLRCQGDGWLQTVTAAAMHLLLLLTRGMLDYLMSVISPVHKSDVRVKFKPTNPMLPPMERSAIRFAFSRHGVLPTEEAESKSVSSRCEHDKPTVELQACKASGQHRQLCRWWWQIHRWFQPRPI